MDLNKTMKNLSLWEVKSYVRKAQNAVLNLSEIESKVREATNNEPWGASNTLMADIARGTFTYKDREEICNMIFRRFTEKAANEWRQIYKSLQLLEYLVKNGSERFVDDARANVSLVSMLKSFHYIDSKGVDQGINIRNRAKELTNLLNDESKIRTERKKAKENAKKFDAISSTSVSTRGYTNRNRGGLGSGRGGISVSADDEYETRIFGDGGVYGQRFEEARTGGNAFEEYDESPVVTSNSSNARRSSNGPTPISKEPIRTAKPTVAQSAGDLLDDDFDEFDDFQSAPAATTAPAPSNITTTTQPLFNTQPQTNNFSNTPLFTNSNVNTTTSAPTPTPAPAAPANVDFFSSLLSDVKTTPSYTPSHTSTPTNTNSNTNTNTNTTTTTTQTPAAPAANSFSLLDL